MVPDRPRASPRDERSPLVSPLVAGAQSSAEAQEAGEAAASTSDSPAARRWQLATKKGIAASAIGNELAKHTIIAQKEADPGLENFSHDPAMLYRSAPEATARRHRSTMRGRYFPHNNTVLGALEAIFFGELRPATVFSSMRLMLVVLTHLVIALALAIGYYFIEIHSERGDFLAGIKDFADLCVTGIVFLLGGFVTTMLTRWWAFRTQCCGGLHQASTCMCTYAASIWPSASVSDREARSLVARYCIAAYQLLFIEARCADLIKATSSGKEGGDVDGVTQAVRDLVRANTLKPEEGARARDANPRDWSLAPPLCSPWRAPVHDPVPQPPFWRRCPPSPRLSSAGLPPSGRR